MGLIKSCSHRAVIDAEIVEECTGHVLIKSTNYVPLWISLLKAHQHHSFNLYLSKNLSFYKYLKLQLFILFTYLFKLKFKYTFYMKKYNTLT